MVLWFILAACSNNDADTEEAEAPTYYADVQPLMAQHCTRCHNSDGVGVGDFTNVEEVELFAPAIQAAVLDGRMPPPASNPNCQDYVGSDNLNLSDAEKTTIVDWVEADTPLGDPADETEFVEISDQLEDPDMVLTMSAPYVPLYADESAGGNEYRCFILEKPEDRPSFYITAMAPTIDKDAIAHHAVLFRITDDERAAYESSDGVDCMDNMDTVNGMLSAWAPGMLPIEFPAGHGLHVAENEHIILQMHYYAGPDQRGLADQSGFAFRTTDAVDTEILMAPIGAFDFEIPAGDDDYTFTEEFSNTFTNLKIFGMFPHMHILGQRFSTSIQHDDGTRTCLVEGDYDFDNQMTYQFTEPVTFGRGETISFSCNWNNSLSNPDLPYDAPQTTYYGERTDEEMCYMFTFLAVD